MTAPWWRGLAPVQVEVECSGTTHQVLWADGVVRAPNHPEAEVERTLATLAGERIACIELTDIWARHRADLRVLALTSRGPADLITLRPPGQFPGGPRAGPPGRAGRPVPSPPAGAGTRSRVSMLSTAAYATGRGPQIGARQRPPMGGGPFDDRSYGVPISDTRSGRAVFPDLDAAKVAVAVSGLAPLLWLPSRLRNLDRPSHPVPAMPAHSTG